MSSIKSFFPKRWPVNLTNLSHDVRKLVFGVSDQVKLKLGYSNWAVQPKNMGRRFKFWINWERRVIVISIETERKGMKIWRILITSANPVPLLALSSVLKPRSSAPSQNWSIKNLPLIEAAISDGKRFADRLTILLCQGGQRMPASAIASINFSSACRSCRGAVWT